MGKFNFIEVSRKILSSLLYQLLMENVVNAKIRIRFSLFSLGFLEDFKASLIPAYIWNEWLALLGVGQSQVT